MFDYGKIGVLTEKSNVKTKTTQNKQMHFDTKQVNTEVKIDFNQNLDLSTYITFVFYITVNFTWKLVTGLTLSGACLLLMAALFSCCYLACKEIDFSKASYGMLISVVIMLGGGNYFFNEKTQPRLDIIFICDMKQNVLSICFRSTPLPILLHTGKQT